jgi:hypothetical protein
VIFYSQAQEPHHQIQEILEGSSFLYLKNISKHTQRQYDLVGMMLVLVILALSLKKKIKQ